MNTPTFAEKPGPTRFPTLAPLVPRLGRWFVRSVAVGFGLTALYILSIGPAVQLNKRGVISPETLERIYFPVSFISAVPGSQWVLDRYIRLWADPGHEPEPG
ncbi:MAG: hypothetical protein AB9869_08765 [Verrucomicrobiia bacterium]